MKKVYALLLSLFSAATISAQGLEGIVVERYYVSDTNDAVANADGGILPIRSVAYRIYVDLLPGYKFQAAYGVDVLPLGGNDPGDHELRFHTSSTFFNNEDRGSTSPTYTKTQARNNTVMIDSWFSVGAGCAGNYGVLKSQDDGVATVLNSYTPPVLQNSDTLVGIPLTTEDGLLLGTPEAVTFVGFTPSQLAVFDNTQAGNLISTWDASWASLNGSVGTDSTDNKVLIAQVTTDGDFTFKLNIQIGTPGGGVENYVPDNAVGAEIVMTDLAQTFLSIPSAVSNVQSSAPFELSLYPNPAVNTLIVDIHTTKPAGNNQLTVYDLPGHAVINRSMGAVFGMHQEKVDLSALAPGLYILEVSLNGEMTRQSFIRQ